MNQVEKLNIVNKLDDSQMEEYNITVDEMNQLADWYCFFVDTSFIKEDSHNKVITVYDREGEAYMSCTVFDDLQKILELENTYWSVKHVYEEVGYDPN